MDAYKYDTEPVQKQEEKKTKQRLEICASKYENRSHAFIQSDPKSQKKKAIKSTTTRGQAGQLAKSAAAVLLHPDAGHRGPPPSRQRPPSTGPPTSRHRPPRPSSIPPPAAGHRCVLPIEMGMNATPLERDHRLGPDRACLSPNRAHTGRSSPNSAAPRNQARPAHPDVTCRRR
jgi:hypothetical protein